MKILSSFMQWCGNSQWARAAVVLSGCWVLCVTGALAQSPRIYRCGNAYTNQPDAASHCKPVAIGNVTVIEGTRVQMPSAALPNTHASASAVAGVGSTPTPTPTPTKIDVLAQRQRDSQAQVVLQAELQRAQQQQAELLREWNNGEPERRAEEMRQPQKYQDRVAQLRAALPRVEADVAGLKRELARWAAAAH